MRLSDLSGVDSRWSSHHTSNQANQETTSVDHVHIRCKRDQQPSNDQGKLCEYQDLSSAETVHYIATHETSNWGSGRR